MVGANQPPPPGKTNFRPMREFGLRFEMKEPCHSLKTKSAQSQINPRLLELLQLLTEKHPAMIPLNRGRTVGGGCTLDRCSNPNLPELQAVPPSRTLCLTCPPRLPQGPVKPPPGLVPGKHSPCSIGPVGSRSQSHHHHLGLGIPPSWNRFPPVNFSDISRSLFPGYFLPPLHQPRTPPALNNFLLQSRQTFQNHSGLGPEIRQAVRPIHLEIF